MIRINLTYIAGIKFWTKSEINQTNIPKATLTINQSIRN